jgi:hypothetical protein
LYADFDSIEKVATTFRGKKLEGLELLEALLKGEKVHNFYTFMLITFL